MVFIAQISLTVRVGFPLQDWIWMVSQDNSILGSPGYCLSWSFSGIGGLKDSFGFGRCLLRIGFVRFADTKMLKFTED